MFSQKPCTLAGFEPGSSVPEADGISNVPRLQGYRYIRGIDTYIKLGSARQRAPEIAKQNSKF
jgi:hypothetical protein